MKNDFLSELSENVELLKEHIPNNFFQKCLEHESLIHLHIPKTGGTFFKDVFNQALSINFIEAGHGTCNKLHLFPDPTDAIPGKKILYYPDIEGYKNALKIAIIRNPYDWLVSFYYHEVTNDNDLVPEHLKEILELNNIRGVGSIRKFYKTFEDFIFAYCDPSAYWPDGLKGFKNFIPFQIFDDKGTCHADFCLRNEFLNLACYCLLIGLGVDHKRARWIFDQERINTSARLTSDYRKFYTQKMLDVLTIKLKRENKFLMYDFETGPLDKNFIIDLKNLNYSPISNKIS
tara:strand:+ start:906 stop:1772 length:867 start_codon:yes stop_codon:yes gene_type:complete